MPIRLYEVDSKYVEYLSRYAPLSSFKQKHSKMKNNVDFIKVGITDKTHILCDNERMYFYFDVFMCFKQQ